MNTFLLGQKLGHSSVNLPVTGDKWTGRWLLQENDDNSLNLLIKYATVCPPICHLLKIYMSKMCTLFHSDILQYKNNSHFLSFCLFKSRKIILLFDFFVCLLLFFLCRATDFIRLKNDITFILWLLSFCFAFFS